VGTKGGWVRVLTQGGWGLGPWANLNGLGPSLDPRGLGFGSVAGSKRVEEWVVSGPKGVGARAVFEPRGFGG